MGDIVFSNGATGLSHYPCWQTEVSVGFGAYSEVITTGLSRFQWLGSLYDKDIKPRVPKATMDYMVVCLNRVDSNIDPHIASSFFRNPPNKVPLLLGNPYMLPEPC